MVVLGLLIEYLSLVSTPDLGFNIAMIGVLLYGGALLFALVTLPVELNASRRAKEMLLHEGILYEDEIEGAQKVLSAAALTYLASVLTNLVYFLRFLIRVLTMFGRRERR
jgi:Zn-dependent membrane protease YugP